MTEKHCLFASLLRFTTICTAPPCICFSFLLYFFPSSLSLSLCLRRVLCARRTFSSPLWWYWLQSLPWLQPWSIDQLALLEANKHACNLHKVCVCEWLHTVKPHVETLHKESVKAHSSCALLLIGSSDSQWAMGVCCFSYYHLTFATILPFLKGLHSGKAIKKAALRQKIAFSSLI